MEESMRYKGGLAATLESRDVIVDWKSRNEMTERCEEGMAVPLLPPVTVSMWQARSGKPQLGLENE